MPVATDGLVQFTIDYTFNNTTASSVWHYWNQTNSPIADMEGLVNAFDAVLMPEMVNIMSSTLTQDRIIGRDLLGIAPDYERVPSVTVGGQTGENANNFTALRLDLLVGNKETRRGYKRLPGLIENNIAGNGLSTGYRNLVITNTAVLLTNLVVGAQTFVPIVYGRATATQPTRSIANPITGIAVPNEQTSQTSRKV